MLFRSLQSFERELYISTFVQAATQQDASTKEPEEEVFDSQLRPNDSLGVTQKMTVAERDAALINAWKERQGSLANTEFEDGQVAGGYRRNVVRLQSE